MANDSYLTREAISFGQPYRTHPNGPHKLLTIRKRVGPFPTRRLAWRRVSHYLPDRHSSPDFTSDSSSSGSSLDSLSDTSLGPPSDSLLVYPPVMTPCYSEAFSRWRSPTTLASSSTPVSRSISPTHADLLPPHKRFKDSYSPEDSREEHIAFERSLDSSSPSAGASHKRCRSPTTLVPSSTPVLRLIAPTLADILPPRKSIGDGVGAHTEDGIGMGVEIAASDIKEDEEEFETA
ncbi:hypothetical protein Tco_0584474 [Tanacetum coccineum]